MEEAERAARSQENCDGPAPTYSGKSYHTHLTLHFPTYDLAEAYSAKFRAAKIRDSDGQDIIYSHKDRIDSRPPQITRRGVALSPLYGELKAALGPNEKLDQACERRDGQHFTIFYGIDEQADVVRELVQAHWEDNQDVVRVTKLSDWANWVPEKVKTATASAAGL